LKDNSNPGSGDLLGRLGKQNRPKRAGQCPATTGKSIVFGNTFPVWVVATY